MRKKFKAMRPQFDSTKIPRPSSFGNPNGYNNHFGGNGYGGNGYGGNASNGMNDYSHSNSNQMNQMQKPHAINNINGNHNGNGFTDRYPSTKTEPKSSFRRGSHGRKRSFDEVTSNVNRMQIHTTNQKMQKTEVSSRDLQMTHNILDHIELFQEALDGNGDELYERKECPSVLESLKKRMESNDTNIPPHFDYPYCLPFYDKPPETVLGKVPSDAVFTVLSKDKSSKTQDTVESKKEWDS